MTNFERAAVYADLADAHVVAALEALNRGDVDSAKVHEDAASEYFQAEHDVVCGALA